jgi:hypothetical protein
MYSILNERDLTKQKQVIAQDQKHLKRLRIEV